MLSRKSIDQLTQKIEDEAIALYNRGYYADTDYDVDDMTYDHEFSDIREETD